MQETLNDGSNQVLTISGSGGLCDYLAKYVQQTSGQPISKLGWYQEANSGAFSTDASTYDLTGHQTSASVQIGVDNVVEETAKVSFLFGTTPSVTVSVTDTAGGAEDYSLLGSAYLQTVMDSGATGVGSGSSILIGGSGATLTGGTGNNLLLALGADDTVTGGAGPTQILLAGLDDTASAMASGSLVAIKGADDSATIGANGTVTVTGTAGRRHARRSRRDGQRRSG